MRRNTIKHYYVYYVNHPLDNIIRWETQRQVWSCVAQIVFSENYTLAGRSTSWNQECWEKYQQPQICRWHHSYGRKWRGTKGLLMKVKKESEKVKLNIQKTKIMASGPITLWQIDGGKVETVTDFIWGGSKITADGDCRHEMKRPLPVARKLWPT